MLNNLEKFTWAEPGINIKRSKFDRSYPNVLTMKSGLLIPVFLDHAMSGDTMELSMASVTRMLSPVVPTMGDVVMDVYFFSIPYRIICDEIEGGTKVWQQVCGENIDGYWAPNTEKTLKEFGIFKVNENSLANYLGYPQGTFSSSSSVLSKAVWDKLPKTNALDLGAYLLVWNEYFRDPNTQAPKTINNLFSNVNAQGVPYYYISNGAPFPVNKLHDYFTSCLITPQRAWTSVKTPLGEMADIKRKNDSADIYKNVTDTGTLGSGNVSVSAISGATNTTSLHANSKELAFQPDNLYADLTTATASTINQLRTAFAIQRMYEKDARSTGGRYRSIILAHFGTKIKDNTVQVPEYIGGKRIPLVVNQVIQSAPGDGSTTTELGTTGAFSNTNDKSDVCIKSFDEHCVVLGVACIRNKQQYCQGLDRFKTKFRRFDFYWPGFANLGEMAVFNRELKLTGDASSDGGVFGYQEAWAEYRAPAVVNNVVGAVSPVANDATLQPYSYCNNFSSVPTLVGFMPHDPATIGQTLYDTSTETQFLVNFYFKNQWIRPMPVVSIPGLIDHN